MDTTERGSDPEQEEVEKGSGSCAQPRVSLQLPGGKQGAWSSSAGSMVIKVQIEPLRPGGTASLGSGEAVSVRGGAALLGGHTGWGAVGRQG